MTLTAIINTHRLALLRMIAMLFEASGMVPGQPAMLSRIIRGSVLHSLRPMEAAGRRLVAVIAERLRREGYLPPVRAALTKPIPRGKGTRAPVFPLFDPRRRVATGRPKYAKHAPRIFFFDGSDPVVEPMPEKAAVDPDEPADATRLCRRLEALKAALENLPGQARRLIRMQTRRAAAGKGLIRVMRPGRPPGHRAKGKHDVDEILRECHDLALRAMVPPDTS